MKLVELLLLFFVAPALIAWRQPRVPLFFLLWALCGYCLAVLALEHKLNLATIFPSSAQDFSALPYLLAEFALAAGILFFFLRREPPRNPKLWMLITFVYPIFSVYPQGIVYRAFFFHRYPDFFPDPKLMIFMSALAFALGHALMRNRAVIGLTAAGGLLFAFRYATTGSLFISCVEHALYGWLMFGIGLGESFYYRAKTLKRNLRS